MKLDWRTVASAIRAVKVECPSPRIVGEYGSSSRRYWGAMPRDLRVLVMCPLLP